MSEQPPSSYPGSPRYGYGYSGGGDPDSGQPAQPGQAGHGQSYGGPYRGPGPVEDQPSTEGGSGPSSPYSQPGNPSGYPAAPPPGYGQSSPGYGQPPAGYGQSSPGYGQPALGYGAPAGNYTPVAIDPGRTLGLVGFIASLVIFVWPATVAGLICSIIGYRMSKKAGFRNGLALAGIIISAIVLFLYVAGFILFIIVMSMAPDSSTTDYALASLQAVMM